MRVEIERKHRWGRWCFLYSGGFVSRAFFVFGTVKRAERIARRKLKREARRRELPDLVVYP